MLTNHFQQLVVLVLNYILEKVVLVVGILVVVNILTKVVKVKTMVVAATAIKVVENRKVWPV